MSSHQLPSKNNHPSRPDLSKMTSNLLSDGGYEASSMWTGHGTRQVAQPEPLSDKELTDMACAVDLVADMGDEQFASPYREDSDIKAEVLAFARAVIAADRVRWGPEEVTDEELYQFWESHPELGLTCDEPVKLLRAVLTRYARPTIKPVPAAERLPGLEDCDAEGRCWLGHNYEPEEDNVGPLWYLLPVLILESPTTVTHWLPHDALPVPGAEVE
jgi:hypothetical protein